MAEVHYTIILNHKEFEELQKCLEYCKDYDRIPEELNNLYDRIMEM